MQAKNPIKWVPRKFTHDQMDKLVHQNGNNNNYYNNINNNNNN